MMKRAGTDRDSEDEHGSGKSGQSESDEDYKYVFDHLSVCMFFVEVTPDGRFRYAGFNPAEEKVTGLSSQQVRGKFVEEVFAPDLAQKLVGNYRRCLEAGTPITYNDELNLPAGSRYFHSNLIPFRNTAGEIHRIVGACIDTTDLKRTQQEAIGSQKLESLGVMAATIAHDFINLLTSILAQAELAETKLTAGLSSTEEIRAIRTAAKRGSEIVRELVSYAGQDPTIREPADLNVLVQEVLQLLTFVVSKRATIRVAPLAQPAVVQAHPAQLRQVIMNLVTNASEALQGKYGAISIDITAVTDRDIRDSRLTPAEFDWVRLTVADTGVGMTPEVLSRIFEPFYTTKSSGRGLGLAAVQGIVRNHGGVINVTSAPGKGSEFEILLPCMPVPR